MEFGLTTHLSVQLLLPEGVVTECCPTTIVTTALQLNYVYGYQLSAFSKM